jgi:hypothetical protein
MAMHNQASSLLTKSGEIVSRAFSPFVRRMMPNSNYTQPPSVYTGTATNRGQKNLTLVPPLDHFSRPNFCFEWVFAVHVNPCAWALDLESYADRNRSHRLYELSNSFPLLSLPM